MKSIRDKTWWGLTGFLAVGWAWWVGGGAAAATAMATTTTTTTTTATATATAKTKYRDLSTTAAKCAAFGRDDVCLWWVGEEQTTATTTAKYQN
jgi:hypothetical protein